MVSLPSDSSASGAPMSRRPRRRALVTGGGVRVGRAIALALGKAGYDVAVHYRSSETAAGEVVSRLQEMGRKARALQADLADPDQLSALFRELRSEWDRIDLLVNNAAAFPPGRPEEVSVEEWDRLFALNLRAPFLCARQARRLMRAGAAIVNVADVAAFEAWPGYLPYAATQAGLVSVTRSLALAWAPEIRVNAVAPGAVLLPEGATSQERRSAAERSALGRVGRAEDVARAVLYLAEADYVTGEVLRVDGGAHLMRTWRPPGLSQRKRPSP